MGESDSWRGNSVGGMIENARPATRSLASPKPATALLGGKNRLQGNPSRRDQRQFAHRLIQYLGSVSNDCLIGPPGPSMVGNTRARGN